MKLTKSLFMLCAAGLSLCACNSDDKLQVPEGPGMIEVKIGSPATRVNTGDKINISGTITITLTHNENQTLTQEVVVVDGQVDPRQQTVKFWNVVNPQKVTASINGGIASYTAIDITQESGNGGNLQADPADIPAYGETQTFTLTGTMKPTGTEDVASGYKSGDEDKTFQKYAAKVQMAIPVARLEVGAITHEAHTAADDCFFKNLKIKGVYLDNTSTDGYGGTYSNLSSAYSEVGSENYNGIGDAILKKTVDAPTDATFAESAFNFYATGGTPTFKVYFSSADFAAGGNDQNREAWAMVTKYKKENDVEITEFENGKVYVISDITLSDEYILGDEENNAVYGVEVTVREAVWTVQLTSVEWAQ